MYVCRGRQQQLRRSIKIESKRVKEREERDEEIMTSSRHLA